MGDANGGLPSPLRVLVELLYIICNRGKQIPPHVGCAADLFSKMLGLLDLGDLGAPRGRFRDPVVFHVRKHFIHPFHMVYSSKKDGTNQYDFPRTFSIFSRVTLYRSRTTYSLLHLQHVVFPAPSRSSHRGKPFASPLTEAHGRHQSETVPAYNEACPSNVRTWITYRSPIRIRLIYGSPPFAKRKVWQP